MVFQNSINHEKPILYFFMLLMEKSKNIIKAYNVFKLVCINQVEHR